MKILYISPHLSTGGCPQFLLKKIQVLHNDHEIHCIEYADHGRFNVQKNRIKEILGDRLYRVNDRREEIIDIVEKVKPDIIHLEEMPEYFMDKGIALKLYFKDRKYKIIETSHDSSFDPKNKAFFPDRFIFVSKYQEENMKVLGIPSEVCEYPIGIVPRKKREDALKILGLDPRKKHVVHVGLFTPRKNQAEIIKYAKLLIDHPIQFHFVGNQADNFRFYWEPLMKDFPKNCKWWDERKDVDNFYQAADLFLFPSKDGNGDKETSPLVIREAISYNIPSLIYNSPVYMGMYDKYDNIKYLSYSDVEQNCKSILEILGLDIKKEIIMAKTQKMNDYKFDSRWDMNEQKMFYSCNKNIDFPITVALREYQSNAVMWAAEYQSFPANCEFWMVPIPKSSRDYSTYEYYSGIKLCIYKRDTNEQIYEKPYHHRFISMPTVSISNRVPYYFNYIEYFLMDKYGEWMNGKKFQTAVDVGANTGIFTEYLIRKKLAKNIIAVECDKVPLEDLKSNYELNDNVTVIDKALSHNNEPIVFYRCPENSVISSALPPDSIKHHRAGLIGSEKTVLETVTIKELIDISGGHINLLKIDIEGAEYNVIEKMDPKLFDHIDNLFIECHFFVENYKELYAALISKVKNAGYIVEEHVVGKVEEYEGASECIFAYKE